MEAQSNTLLIIGRMHTPFAGADDCPRHEGDSLAEGIAEIFPPFVPALDTLAPGQKITLVSWLDQADRSVLNVYPRGDHSRPRRGVFNSRSPSRPNPLGLHGVHILEVLPPEANGSVRLRVAYVDMVDGTPLVDIKSANTRLATRFANENAATRSAGAAADASGTSLDPLVAAIGAACRDAWRRGLFSGFNGNVSLRVGRSCLITRTRCPKSALTAADFSLLSIADASHLEGAAPSSEAPLHCAVYRALPRIEAVAHTHPPHLLALDALRHPLFPAHENSPYEREQCISQLTQVPALPPGSPELAKAVALACQNASAVWMRRHGLVTLGKNPRDALALAEEFDHLARVELLSVP